MDDPSRSHGAGSDRLITLRTGTGKPVVSVRMLHGAAAAAVALMVAPRMTAAAAIAGMMRGMSLTVEETAHRPRTAA